MTNNTFDIFISWIPILLLIGVYLYVMRKMGNSTGSKKYMALLEENNWRLEEVVKSSEKTNEHWQSQISVLKEINDKFGLLISKSDS